MADTIFLQPCKQRIAQLSHSGSSSPYAWLEKRQGPKCSLWAAGARGSLCFAYLALHTCAGNLGTCNTMFASTHMLPDTPHAAAAWQSWSEGATHARLSTPPETSAQLAMFHCLMQRHASCKMVAHVESGCTGSLDTSRRSGLPSGKNTHAPVSSRSSAAAGSR